MVLFCGTDEYLASKAAREYVDQRCPPADAALGLEIVEGAVDDGEAAVRAVRHCVDGLRTVGFFGANKVVWLRDVSFFKGGNDFRGEEVKQALAELTGEIEAGIPPGVCLVLNAPNVDGRLALVKAVKACGVVREFNVPDKGYKVDAYAKDFVADRLREAGLRAANGVPQLMVERAGPDSRLLVQEVDKLKAYVGKRDTVTEEDVLAIVSPGREREAWDLADAVTRKDLVGALAVARNLMFMGTNPVPLVINLQYRVRELLVLKICLDRGWLRLTGSSNWLKPEWSVSGGDGEAFVSALSPDPRKGNPFRTAILASGAKGFRIETLKRFQELTVSTHEQMLSGAAPADLLLERMLILMLGRKRGQG